MIQCQEAIKIQQREELFGSVIFFKNLERVEFKTQMKRLTLSKGRDRKVEEKKIGSDGGSQNWYQEIQDCFSDGFSVKKRTSSSIKNEVRSQKRGNLLGRIQSIKKVQSNY